MVVETLSLPGEGEGGDDGGANLSLGDEEGEVEGVGEHVVLDEIGEEGHQMEEGVRGSQRS